MSKKLPLCEAVEADANGNVKRSIWAQQISGCMYVIGEEHENQSRKYNASENDRIFKEREELYRTGHPQ